MRSKCQDMRFLFICSLLSILSGSIELKSQPARVAGGIKGKITDQEGTPLPFAGINVKGTNLGTLSNSEGIYELFLQPGEYTVHFQYLGFRTETKEISVTGGMTPLDISLREQALALRELQVGKDPEDPAYTIMRKAISKARFHQLQVQSYSASVYARSTALPTKIPVLMRKRLKKQGISEGVAFVNESVTKVDYQRPNSYKQKIISTQNNIDNSTPTPNEFIFASFYNPEVGGTVTPLSPKALGIYKFEYEGYFEDRGEIVNKIKVTPKSFKQGVFKGSIYIIEGKWSIHSFTLETIWQGFSIRVRQLFTPSQNVWIPGSQHFDINGSYLGFAGKFTYIVSIQYDNLRIDPTLQENVTIVDTKKEPESKPEISNAKKLEELLSDGQKADTKSFRKMVKQYEKEQRKAENPGLSTRETRRDSIVVEPLANKRDSVYWAAMRSVPLTRTEVVSYAVSDSITAIRTGGSNKPADSTSFKPQHLLTGARYRYGRGRSLSLAPPFRSVGFNPVEAFHLDLSAEWRERYANRKSFSVSPALHYSTGRNRVSPTLKLQLNNSVSSISLEGGEQIAQFNPQQPVSPAVNSIYYLLFNQNHIRLFQKQFINLEYRQRQIFNILNLAAGIETGKRALLQNLRKSGELLWGDPHLERNDNMPDNVGDLPVLLPDDRYTAVSLRLDIRPWQRFTVRNGRKRFFSNNQPVFAVQYRKGISLFNSLSDYDFLEGSVRYEPKVFAASTLRMSVSGGKFLNRNAVFFPDFKHFMGNRTIIQTGDHLSGFRMLPYYRYSTSTQYTQAHVSFNSPKLLLTQLPLLRLAGLKEYIQGHMLHTPDAAFYTEQVYGVDGILKIFRAELVTHFNRDLYLGLGFRIGTVFNF